MFFAAAYCSEQIPECFLSLHTAASKFLCVFCPCTLQRANSCVFFVPAYCSDKIPGGFLSLHTAGRKYRIVLNLTYPFSETCSAKSAHPGASKSGRHPLLNLLSGYSPGHFLILWYKHQNANPNNCTNHR